MANLEYYKHLALDGLKCNLRYNEYILDSLPYHYQLEMKTLVPKLKKFNKGLLEISDDMVEGFGIQYPAIYESTKSMFFSKHKGRWDILTVGGGDTNGYETILTYNPPTEMMIVQNEDCEIVASQDTILTALKLLVKYHYWYLSRTINNPEITQAWELFNKIVI